MSGRIPDPTPGHIWGRTANDDFKSRSRRRLWWSLAAAAGFHALLLAWSPTWERATPPDPMAGPEMGTEVLALGPDFGQPEAVMPGTIVPEDAGESSTPDEDAEEEAADPAPEAQAPPGSSVAGAYASGGADALLAELQRRSAPVPSLAEEDEPEPEPEGDEAANDDLPEGEEDRPRIDGIYELLEEDTLTRDEILALERLSALRPELALASRTNWILLRNPTDVERFLRERFDGPEEGVVSVALWVNERGSVEWAEIQQSSGQPDVDESALELFREVASFRPARERGTNVPMALVLSVPFPW